MHLRSVWILAGALGIASSASANVIVYSAGFEAAEGYSLGQLAGQNGWTSSTLINVENSVFHTGARAASMVSQASGQFVTVAPISYNSVGNPNQIVVVDLWFMMDSSGANQTWTVASIRGDASVFVGQLIVDGGNAKLGLASSTAGSVPVTPNVWHEFQVVLDYQHQTQSASVDNTPIGSGPFANAATQFTLLRIGQNAGTSTNQTGYWDDILVTSTSTTAVTPLPSTVILILTGFLLIGLYRVRRRFVRFHP